MTTIERHLHSRVAIASIPSGLLLIGAFISLASGLPAMVRGLDGGLLWLLSIVGLLAGWFLARYKLPDLPGVLILMLVGFVALVVWLSGLAVHVLIAAWALIGNHTGALLWLYEFQPHNEILSQSMNALVSSFGVIFTRLASWVSSIRLGEPRYDPLITALLWGFTVWSAAVWAGWAIHRRKQVLLVLLPALVLLAGSFGLVRFTPTAILIFFCNLLLLNVLVSQIYREQRWDSANTDYTLEIRYDLAVSAIPLSLLILSAAALIPFISVKQFTDYFQDQSRAPAAQQPSLAESIGLNPSPQEPTGVDKLRSPGLPREHLIGSGPELGKKVVMTITLSGSQNENAGYYWRGLTYDRYTGQGWATHPTGNNNFRPGMKLFSYDPQLFRPLHEDIHRVEPLGGILYHTGLLLTSNRPFFSERRAQLDLFAASIKFNTYQVDSAVPIYNRTDLRSAGIDYPSQVRELYLDLPNDLPQRVYNLARDLTASQANAYDQALTIQDFLRQFPYTLDLPAPPPDRDIADYFLFELKKGYCDYYATAMVVLSRAAGIPARLVMGYASGHYDPTLGAMVITEADAHSWPELYFPGYGWVEFEPTSSRSLLFESDRAIYQSPFIPTPGTQGISGITGLGKKVDPRAFFLLVLGFLVVLLIIIVWDRWRERSQPAVISLERAYRTMRSSAAWLNCPTKQGDTPLETAKRMAGFLEPKQPASWSSVIVLVAQQEILEFTNIYSRAAYGSMPIPSQDHIHGMALWRRLHLRLWLIRLGIPLKRQHRGEQ
ncbi:MAG: transglutaminase domain-containing protein [Anaerolineaceae bacterium]|nr:transglutaminase domain-containing protein [Anaerolineaceae bacterium]